MKLILIIILIISLTGCKLAHMTYSCEYYGCNDGFIPGCMQKHKNSN